MKSSITPELKGDVCASFDKYLMPPVVTEDLPRTNNSRYFWISAENTDPWCVNGLSPHQQARKWSDNPDDSEIIAEPGVFSLKRAHKNLSLDVEIVITVPHTKDKVELWKVTVHNSGHNPCRFTPFLAVPMFGRHADNLRDHRQVTSMFQIVTRTDSGVSIKPTIVHDEHGHRVNQSTYFAAAFNQDGQKPDRIWTRMLDFIGEGGSLSNPQAVYHNLAEPSLSPKERNGVDSLAAMSFPAIELNAGEETSLIMILGITDENDQDIIVTRYNTAEKFNAALSATTKYWSDLTGQVEFKTGNPDFDEWMRWLAFQLKCRQIFGNSFLPDFGYGRGGRGWRDLWQDLLSIFLVDPESARHEIVNNFKGVRIDGSNATIIGSSPGEFKADRNNIPRTWCDHGAWPLFSLNFYIQQTGDFEVLLKDIEYWKDSFVSRSKARDEKWLPEQGNWLLKESGEKYLGSLLEHVLIQQLSAFYHVGEHNILLLEGADWNDTLDMARNRGESVCFQNFYAGNLGILIDLLESLKNRGIQKVELLQEMSSLFDRTMSQLPLNYEKIDEKRRLLDSYFTKVKHKVSGQKLDISIDELIQDLKSKENHSKKKIESGEWISIDSDKGFFNGHYDDLGRAMHGKYPEGYRIDLTSQVMPVMFDVASDKQIDSLFQSAKELLGDAGKAGLRLCTPYPDIDMNIGRITGFVYGYKEHGSKWMQQNIMFMYGLFHRNHTEAGYEIFHDIFDLSNNSGVSKTFPGIPSYYDPEDRGAYMYLTGSSTWIFLSIVTQLFGVRGKGGKLLLNPKLSPWFFDENKEASVRLNFNNQRIQVCYSNPSLLKVGEYQIKSVVVDDKEVFSGSENAVLIETENFKSAGRDLINVQINLG